MASEQEMATALAEKEKEYRREMLSVRLSACEDTVATQDELIEAGKGKSGWCMLHTWFAWASACECTRLL